MMESHTVSSPNKKRRTLTLIFAVLLIAATFFVWWMSFSGFKSSYKEIKQQYYSVVAGQVVSELEASINYGKSLDSFYNIGRIFAKLTSLLPEHIEAVITNRSGEVLYTSFERGSRQEIMAVLENEKVVVRLVNASPSSKYSSFEQDSQELMLLPITDKSQAAIGSLVLVYPSAALNGELAPQQRETIQLSLLVLGISLLILIFALWVLPVSEETVKSPSARQRLLQLIPALIVMVCLSVQSATMYAQYEERYKSALADGAAGILNYIETTVGSLYEKGIAYEQMEGITEYLTTKAKDTPIIWNIRIYNSIADTDEILERVDSWRISAPLSHKEEGTDTRVEIQISQEYMNDQMKNLLLVFLITMIASAVVVFEVMRLPELLLFRRSSEFNRNSALQEEKITLGLRIINFIFFMALYASMPFSSILVRQWDGQLWGLSTDVTASLPITFELLSLMLCSLLFARFSRHTGKRTFLILSAVAIISGNVLSALAAGPQQLILCRVLCGAGFAGVKTAVNAIIASGSQASNRTGLHIAAMNAGLLGGIMCGGSLGAAIANSIGASYTYQFTAGLILAFLAITLHILPWKLLNEKHESYSGQKKSKTPGILPVLWQRKVLGYLVLVTLPLNLGLMFIVSFIPSYVEKLSLPVILISYGYLVNGLLGIYLGPLLAKNLTKRMGKAMSVAVMLFMGAAALLVLSINPMAAVILLSTALMGLFDGFGSPVSTDYFLDMPEIKEKLDIPSALAFLGVIGNAVQMLSPMIYGWLLLMGSNTGINTILVLGLIYLVFGLLFLSMFRRSTSFGKKERGFRGESM
ncbi:MFS transporter [Desulfitobacterium hafniense]|uniref:MFS transporter n=1 Tax=Desulfitobacterium hafniense TaxID=49338 RepID=UPI00036D1D84|nr:MFS transporter [Desulfitobacterium hafniense]